MTGLTSIATIAALGIMIVGILAVVEGSYDKKVVHDQLVPQKIFPPPTAPSRYPGVKQYAGQQLTTGSQAKAYANNFINVHLSKIAWRPDLRTSQHSRRRWCETNTKLAEEKATLFQGETLRGLLLNAWGWSLCRHHRHPRPAFS